MKVLFIVLALLTAACHTPAPTYSVALAPDLSIEDLQELRQVISTAIDRPSVRLNQDVFSTSHILALEHTVGTTPLGRIATGRTTTKPEMFHLLSNGENCVLERVSTGQRYLLTLSCQQQ